MNYYAPATASQYAIWCLNYSKKKEKQLVFTYNHDSKRLYHEGLIEFDLESHAQVHEATPKELQKLMTIVFEAKDIVIE
jgi:hypothetical protein